MPSIPPSHPRGKGCGPAEGGIICPRVGQDGVLPPLFLTPPTSSGGNMQPNVSAARHQLRCNTLETTSNLARRHKLSCEVTPFPLLLWSPHDNPSSTSVCGTGPFSEPPQNVTAPAHLTTFARGVHQLVASSPSRNHSPDSASRYPVIPCRAAGPLLGLEPGNALVPLPGGKFGHCLRPVCPQPSASSVSN